MRRLGLSNKRKAKSDFAAGGARVILRYPIRRMMMKAFLAAVAALGLSISTASATCPYHQSLASASVDTTKTASVEKSDMSKATDTQKIIKKQAPPKTE
jgi:hypothetical protein